MGASLRSPLVVLALRATATFLKESRVVISIVRSALSLMRLSRLSSSITEKSDHF